MCAPQAHEHDVDKQCPGVKQTQREASDIFDDLFATPSSEFHVSYIANIEATFTPLFKLFLITATRSSVAAIPASRRSSCGTSLKRSSPRGRELSTPC